MKAIKHSTLGIALLATLSFATTAQAQDKKTEAGQASLSSQQITEAQNKLNEKGFNVGKADGVIGKKTQEGIKKFQKENNESATGQLDQKTLAALGVQMNTQQSGEATKEQPMEQKQPEQQQPGTADQAQSQGQDQGQGQSQMDQNNYPAGNNNG